MFAEYQEWRRSETYVERSCVILMYIWNDSPRLENIEYNLFGDLWSRSNKVKMLANVLHRKIS